MNWIRTRDFRDTGALLYQLRFEATTWERGQFVEFISPARVFAPNVWLHSSVGTASHRYRGGHGFESRWSPDFFRLLLSNYLKWKIYCDDLSLLWSTTAVHIWIISYILHAMENLFANNFPGLFTIATNGHYMLAEIVGSWFTARGRSEWIIQPNIFAVLRS